MAKGYTKLIQRLVALRKKHGISQEYVASKMNKTQSAISRIESGRQQVTEEEFELYARTIDFRVLADEALLAEAVARRLEQQNNLAYSNLAWWTPWRVIALAVFFTIAMSDDIPGAFRRGYNGTSTDEVEPFYFIVWEIIFVLGMGDKIFARFMRKK